jgi:H+/gluconate symporter-like permease
MGQSIWLAVILALILQWVFGLNFWTAVIIAVVAAPIIGAIFKSTFGSKTVPAPQAGQGTQNAEEGNTQPPEEGK